MSEWDPLGRRETLIHVNGSDVVPEGDARDEPSLRSPVVFPLRQRCE